jgi:cell wall-associated NlpC family hydrolase
MWTAKKQRDATREMTVMYGKKWIGRMVTDCSGLLRWALYQLGETIVHHARYQYTDYCTNKGKLVDGLREDGMRPLPGSAVFLKGSEPHIHHVGVYVGHNTVVEAKGTIYGVVTSHLDHWDYWGELKMIDYTNAAELEDGEPAWTQQTEEDAAAGTIIMAVVNNPQTWLNVRSGPGSEYNKVFRVQKGTTVEVLDAGEPSWWKIRSEGRTGWAAAQHLTVIRPEQSEPEQPEVQPEPKDMSILDELAIRDRLDALINRLN